MCNTKNVVPAQAGTHTPQQFGSIDEGKVIHKQPAPGLWVPACAGTTLRGGMTPYALCAVVSPYSAGLLSAGGVAEAAFLAAAFFSTIRTAMIEPS